MIDARHNIKCFNGVSEVAAEPYYTFFVEEKLKILEWRLFNILDQHKYKKMGIEMCLLLNF